MELAPDCPDAMMNAADGYSKDVGQAGFLKSAHGKRGFFGTLR